VAWLSITCFFWLPSVGTFLFDECRSPDRSELNSVHHDDTLFQHYQCPNASDYNEMASLSFTGGEKTIKSLFHSYNTGEYHYHGSQLSVLQFVHCDSIVGR
jgi:hypothetical protein